MLNEIQILYMIVLYKKYKIADWADTSNTKIYFKDLVFTSNKLRKFLLKNKIEF